MSKPIVIKGPLPGQAVDGHLKQFGHLPVTDLCDREGTCVRRLPELVERIVGLEAELETSNAHRAVSTLKSVTGEMMAREVLELLSLLRDLGVPEESTHRGRNVVLSLRGRVEYIVSHFEDGVDRRVEQLMQEAKELREHIREKEEADAR